MIINRYGRNTKSTIPLARIIKAADDSNIDVLDWGRYGFFTVKRFVTFAHFRGLLPENSTARWGQIREQTTTKRTLKMIEGA